MLVSSTKKTAGTMELHNSEQSTEIEKFWTTLSLEDQKKLFQKFVEVGKQHVSPAPEPSSPIRIGDNHVLNKHILNSPETPNKGQSRKVSSIINKMIESFG
jgi:hypothetical protein